MTTPSKPRPKAPPAPPRSRALDVDDERTEQRRRPITVALCVTGSIAAYKAAELARLLLAEGAHVLPVMTRAAREFLGPSTLAGLTGEPVREDLWDPSYAGELHVELARRADVIVIAPATADTLARLAQGRADDLVTALALSTERPIVVAPAMHPSMWAHPATARNVGLLADDGRVVLVGPVDGPVASGESGVGRLADPSAIAEAVVAAGTPKDLVGLRIVVTAGPTVEDLDPVRFLSNRSTGKMGFAVARRAAARGAEVTLIAGPVSLPTPAGARRVDVRSAISMRSALWQALGPDLSHADALVMSAAVSDYRPTEEHASKQKKQGLTGTIDLTRNPDLLAEIGAARSGTTPVLVGFAVETDTDTRIVQYAEKKLREKRVDLVVANHARESFGRDDNRAFFVSKEGARAQGPSSKLELADRLLDELRARLGR